MKLSTALGLGRVSNLPTVASNVLTGVALSGQVVSVPTLLGWMLAMASFYTGGMYLNDAFDRAWDAKNRPERPIPSGEVSARTVFTAGFSMLALGVLGSFVLAGGLSSHGLSAGVAALALAGTIVAYDAHHKQNPFGPLLMGLCRVLIYVTVALGCSGQWGTPQSLSALALLGYLMGLTYVARQENLRELTNLWPLVLLSAPLWVALPRALDLHALYVALWLGWTLYALRFLFVDAVRSIPGAVARLIAGIALVDALLVTDERGRLVCVGCLIATRVLHRKVAGT